MHLKRYVIYRIVLMTPGRYRHVLYIQHHISRLAFFLLYCKIDITANHHRRQLLRCGILCLYGTHIFSLAEYGTTVSNLHNL